MFTASQLVAHLVGDYLLQSDWMSSEKTKQNLAAYVHAMAYSLPFLFFTPSRLAWLFIVGTHFLIDRYRLAKYVCWAKNFLAPRREISGRDVNGIMTIFSNVRNWPWHECQTTGYGPDKPIWMSTWLLIIADNTMHIICNGVALSYL